MLGPMSRWLRPIWGWLLVAALGCGQAPAPPPSAEDADAKKSVELIIDFGDATKKSYRVPWSPKLTVLAAMERAAKTSEFEFQHRHRGEMAFLDAIGATRNETGRSARVWIYHVNGQEADVGFGARELAPGDVVLWRFQKSQYNP